MFEGIKKIGSLIWLGIGAIVAIITGLFIHKSNKETNELNKKTEELIAKSRKTSSELKDAVAGLETNVKNLITDHDELMDDAVKRKLELDKWNELVRKSFDDNLDFEERWNAIDELERLAGVPEEEIKKQTPEYYDKLFKK